MDTNSWITWRTVESGNIAAIGWPSKGFTGWHGEGLVMFVRFHRGGTYAYLGVSRQRAVALAFRRRLWDRSITSYLNKVIKPQFGALKIKDALT